MSFSPEIISRINRIKKAANDIKDVAPNNPKVHDFLRNGQGAGDIIWLINLLVSNTKENESDLILTKMREICHVNTNEQLLNKVRNFQSEKNRTLTHNDYNMTFGHICSSNHNDDEIDYYDDHDPELDGYEEEDV